MTSSRLTALLNELGDCLQAASDSGTSPQGSELQLHARIRTVLVSLFAECIDTKTGLHYAPPGLRAFCAVLWKMIAYKSLLFAPMMVT